MTVLRVPFKFWSVIDKMTSSILNVQLVRVCRLVLGQYSKQWFGLGLEEWQGGAQADKIIKAIQTAFAVLGDKHFKHGPQERAKIVLVDYFTAVLAAVSTYDRDHDPWSQLLHSSAGSSERNHNPWSPCSYVKGLSQQVGVGCK